MSLLSRAAAISPFGPIFGKELRVTARRKRSYMLRVGYLGLLLLALWVGYLSMGQSGGGVAARAQRQAQLGMMFFAVFSMFCVFTMGIICPVLTATAIGSERLARTLPVLLMTPINAWQVVGGKLFSRLLAALTLIGLSLPVLALVRLMGGVESEQMAAVLCICTSFALSCAAVGLFFSTLMNRASAVILLSYGVLGFLYAVLPFVLVAGLRLREREHAIFIAAINPFFATVIQWEPGFLVGVRGSWIACTIVQLSLAAAMVLCSALVLRRSARQAGERIIPSAPADGTAAPMDGPPVDGAALATSPAATFGAPDAGAVTARPGPPPLPWARGEMDRPAPQAIPYASPPPPGATGRFRPWSLIRFCFGAGPLARHWRRSEVSDHPILWRELHRPLLAKVWQRITATAVCGGVLLLIFATLARGNDLFEDDTHTGFAVIYCGTFWLLVSVLSATAIAAEKESDTWTLLLASPVSGAAIVLGKAAGLLRRLFWPIMLVAGHFTLFTLTGTLHPGAILLTLWVVLTFNSVWLATGIYLSLKMKRVTFAVIANSLLAILAYCLPYALLYALTRALELDRDIPEHGAWHLPYYYLLMGLHGLEQQAYYVPYGNPYGPSRFYAPYSLPGSEDAVWATEFFVTVFVVGLIHLLAAFLILRQVASRCDAIVGRAGRQAHVGAFESDEAVAPMAPGFMAPLWARAAAAAVDWGLLLSVGALGGMAAALVVGLSIESPTSAAKVEMPEMMRQYAAWGMMLTTLLGWIYFAWCESSRWRATSGKRLFGLYVTDAEGRRVPFGRTLLRSGAKTLGGAALLIGWCVAVFRPDRRALHDLSAGTMVLRR